MEMKRLEIDNSAEAAVKSGKWKNPGSSFYYRILNSFRITDESKDDEDIDKYDFDFKKVLKEAYLIAPVEKIKNTPYGITSYSQSGCKYPHHVIKDGKLVVSVPGIQAAYSRAKQQGIFKGDVKSHIEKHYKELGLDMSTMTECVDPIQEEIDLNFDFIQKHIESTLGVKFVHDDVVMESVDDIVNKEQYIKETFDWMDEILYESDDDYNRKIDEENEFDESDYSDLERIYTDYYLSVGPADKKYYAMQDSMMRFFEDHNFDEIMKLYSGTEEKVDHTSYEDNNFYRTIGVDVNTGKLASVITHGNHSEPNTVAIVFPDNTHVESVEIIPTYMPDFNTFIEAIQSKYDLRQFVTPTMSTTDELPLYEYKFDTLFKDEFIQNEFVNYIKENDVHGDVYTVKSDLPINLTNTEAIDCSVNSYTFPVLSKNVPKAIAQLEKCLENANVLSRKTLGWNEHRVKNYRKSLRKLIESVKWKSLNGIAKRSNRITSIKIYPDDDVIAESVTYNRSGFNGGNTIIPFASDEFHEFMTYFEKTFNLSDFVKNGVLSYPLLFENTLVRKIFGKYFENRYLRTGEDPWKKYSSGMKYTDEYPLSEGIWDNDTLFTEDFNNTGMIKLGRLWKANSVQYQFMESMIDAMDMNPVSIIDENITPDIDEIDFEEKYSAIDATESEWNEFWSLFEQNRLHKTKSQMLNYYNQYLEFIHDSSSDEIKKAHYYKEKIDEMRSDPEYDRWIRRIDLENTLYAEHRLSQLKPISDEEFIDELLENKAGMLALTSSDDTELIERYQNEIAYLVECKYNPSVELDKDAINWEYMNLIRYGTNEAVDVDILRRISSDPLGVGFSTVHVHYQDAVLPYLLESYTLYERTSIIPDVKYSYRLGIDIDNGKLVAIKFKLEPDKITKVGNAAGHVNAYLSKHPEERRRYKELNRKLDQLKQSGNTDEVKKIEHQLKEFEDKVESNANHHKFLNKDGKVTSLVDTLKNVITRTGHIDFVSGDNEIVGIIYRDGKSYTMTNGKGKKVRILPAQSKQVGEFLGRMYNYKRDLMKKFMRPNPSNYIQDDPDDSFVFSLDAAFANPEVQSLFPAFVKQFNYQPEIYEIGKTCGPNKYQSTRVLWDNLLMYRKLANTPQFRGPILDLEVKTINPFNHKIKEYDINYTGLGSPEFIKKESYESGNLNMIIDDVKNNIKKYEEAIQEYISTANQFNIDLLSYLEADDQSEENDQVEDDDTPPNIDLGDEEIESDEPPTIDTDEPEPTEEDTPSEDKVQEDTSDAPDIIEPTSLPKATDAQEENKNGVRRKKLYIAFIEWAKSFNQKNTFGSIFDKDAFDVTYSFVPHEMRYFYRLANPILCVLSGSLTFFQVSELRKLNANNPDMKDALIFAATENDYRVFSTRDKKVYVGVDKEDGSGIAFTKCLADSFDLYIQNMIDQGDILNGPIASESDSNNSDENNDSDKE